jgi:hypothetical protein
VGLLQAQPHKRPRLVLCLGATKTIFSVKNAGRNSVSLGIPY